MILRPHNRKLLWISRCTARRICSEPAAGQESVLGLHQEAQDTRSMSLVLHSRPEETIAAPCFMQVSTYCRRWSSEVNSLHRRSSGPACKIPSPSGLGTADIFSEKEEGRGEDNPHPSSQLLLAATCM